VPRSQLGGDPEEVGGWIRERTAEIGKPAGFEHGESFQVIAQGPGFHAGEQDQEVDFADLPPARHDPGPSPIWFPRKDCSPAFRNRKA
jgi:hypothetical protein